MTPNSRNPLTSQHRNWWVGNQALLIGLAGLIVAGAWASYLQLTLPMLPYDDAYITFRYVNNCVEGHGLVYNLDQKVFGSSTPLYTLVLVAGKMMLPSMDIPTLALWFNVIAFLACGIAVFCLLGRATSNWIIAGLGGMMAMTDWRLLECSTGAMESFFFLGLCLFTLLALSLSRSRPILTGILAGLAMLARPDGLLLVPIIILGYWGQWRRVGQAAGAAAAVVLPWVIFATAYYGSPIPLSIVAKAKPLYPLPAGEAFNSIAEYMAGWISAGKIGAGLGTRGKSIMAALLILTTGMAVVNRHMRQRQAWAPGLLLLLLILFYGTGNALMFEWYYPSIIVTSILALAIGLMALGGTLKECAPSGARSIVTSIMTTLTAILLVVGTVDRYRSTCRAATIAKVPTSDPGRLRVVAYKQAAEWINANKANSTVAAPEIGAFGFFYHGKVLDACGLVSPEAHPFLPVPNEQRAGGDPHVGAISIEMVREWQADYVVTMPIFASASLLRSAWFKDHYELAITIPMAELWTNKGVLIFRKRTPLSARGEGKDKASSDGPPIVQIETTIGAYDRETDGTNWWHWVKDKVSFRVEALSVPRDVARTELHLEYLTRGKQTLTMQLLTLDGTSKTILLHSKGDSLAIFDEVIELPPRELTEVSIETDAMPSPLGKEDARMAAWTVRNVSIKGVTGAK